MTKRYYATFNNASVILNQNTGEYMAVFMFF